MRQKSLLRRLCSLAQIILIHFNVLEESMVKQIVAQHYQILEMRLGTRGIADLISYVKTSRNQFMQYCLDNPLISDPGVDQYGLPKGMPYLKDLSSSRNGIRAALTLLTLTRAFTINEDPDISTITDKWSGSDTITELELSVALRVLNVRRGIIPEWNFPHTSTKSGPSGQALLTSLHELTLLPHQLIADIQLLGGRSLSIHIDECTEGLDILEFIRPKNFKQKYFTLAWWWRTLFGISKEKIRRLSYFPDKEGKTRIIAVFDYWSQSCLRPLHNKVNTLLKRIHSDCTFDQNSFTEKTPTDLKGHSFHSIDLTAATDRMPITLQKRVIEHLFDSKDKSNA